MPTFPLRWISHCKWIYFYSDASGFFHDNPAPIHRARDLTESFDEVENEVNHMPWPSHSSAVSPNKHPWEILDLFIIKFWKVKQEQEQKGTELLHFCSSISFLPLSSWPGFLPSLHSPPALNRLKMFSQMPGTIKLPCHCCSGSLPSSHPPVSFSFTVCVYVCV